jgi:hypothetical protein
MSELFGLVQNFPPWCWVIADLGDFGRYFGQNKEIVSVFYGSVVYFNVGIGLTFLGRSFVVLAKNFTSSYLLKNILAVEAVEILCPEVNMRSSQNTKTISIPIGAIARDSAP